MTAREVWLHAKRNGKRPQESSGNGEVDVLRPTASVPEEVKRELQAPASHLCSSTCSCGDVCWVRWDLIRLSMTGAKLPKLCAPSARLLVVIFRISPSPNPIYGLVYQSSIDGRLLTPCIDVPYRSLIRLRLFVLVDILSRCCSHAQTLGTYLHMYI